MASLPEWSQSIMLIELGHWVKATLHCADRYCGCKTQTPKKINQTKDFRTKAGERNGSFLRIYFAKELKFFIFKNFVFEGRLKTDVISLPMKRKEMSVFWGWHNAVNTNPSTNGNAHTLCLIGA